MSNHELALRGREELLRALQLDATAPGSMIASMASVPIRDRRAESDDVMAALVQRRIEMLIEPWPSAPHRVLRISAQVYNWVEEYEALASALAEILA